VGKSAGFVGKSEGVLSKTEGCGMSEVFGSSFEGFVGKLEGGRIRRV